MEHVERVNCEPAGDMERDKEGGGSESQMGLLNTVRGRIDSPEGMSQREEVREVLRSLQ
jgi:hypothetical protein